MSELLALSYPSLTVNLLTCPLSSILRRILSELLPPNSVIGVIESNVCEDSAFLSASESVVVRLCICSGSNAEEAVLRVDSVESAVLAGLHPSDIVADCEYLIAVLLVSLRGNEHSEVGLTASRRESSSDVLDLAVGLLNAEDEHMLSHPGLVLTLEGSDTESEALLAEENVSAVSRVDRPDSILFRELNDISLLGVNVSLRVETSYEIVRSIAEVLESLLTHTSHDVHVENNVDRVSYLNADLSERRTDRTHRIRDNVHSSALHNAVVHRCKESLHLVGVHPVVCRTSASLFLRADESSVLNAGNVVLAGSVVETVGVLLLIELVHFVPAVIGERSNFFSKGVELLLRAVDPDNVLRLAESDHLIDPF